MSTKSVSIKDAAIQAVKKGSRPSVAWTDKYENYDVSAGYQKFVKRELLVKQIPTGSFEKSKTSACIYRKR